MHSEVTNLCAYFVQVNGSIGSESVKSIVNKQYNSPVGMYSEETIAETLSAQAEVLAGGVLGYVVSLFNFRIYNACVNHLHFFVLGLTSRKMKRITMLQIVKYLKWFKK